MVAVVHATALAKGVIGASRADRRTAELVVCTGIQWWQAVGQRFEALEHRIRAGGVCGSGRTGLGPLTERYGKGSVLWSFEIGLQGFCCSWGSLGFQVFLNLF